MEVDSWPDVRIGDLGEVFTGRTPSTERPSYFGHDFPFITPGDMRQGKYARQTQRSLSQQGAALLNRIQLPPNSVCVSCIGWQMGEVIMTDRPSFTNQQINAIVANGTAEPSFLYYSLLPRKQELLSLGATTGVRTPILNKSAFSDLKVKIPPLPVQRRIAGILSAYDDLIENNTQRIHILEEMAQALYREWFVHSRFPGHDQVKLVDSPVGKVPQGWEVRNIGEVVETLGGGTPSTKSSEYWNSNDVIWFTPSDLTAAGTMYIQTSGKKISKLGLEKSSARLFPPYSVLMTSRATIGVVAINTQEACTNQGFITCIPNENVSAYQIYFWMLDNKEKIIGIASGATYKEINRTEFRELPIVVADKITNESFTATLSPICKQIEVLQTKIENLRRTRDLLLPKLVSGEIRC